MKYLMFAKYYILACSILTFAVGFIFGSMDDYLRGTYYVAVGGFNYLLYMDIKEASDES